VLIPLLFAALAQAPQQGLPQEGPSGARVMGLPRRTSVGTTSFTRTGLRHSCGRQRPCSRAAAELGLAGTLSSQEDKPPSVADLARAGSRSQDRLAAGAASWTAVHENPNGSLLAVAGLKAGPRIRRVLTLEVAGERVDLARIVERDGAWYVAQGDRRGKYRPYEAPLDLSTAYFYLARSHPSFLVDPDVLEKAELKAVRNGIATYRIALPEETRRQLEKSLEAIAEVRRLNPARAADPKLVKAEERSKALLASGIETRIQVSTGLIVQDGTSERRVTFEAFSWVDKADDKEFDVGGARWTDHTGDPTTGDPGQLVMLGNNPLWRPGAPAGELEARFVDLKTGSIRRVPFRDGQALPGCFLKDRTKVLVSGLGQDGAMGLYEVDLKTGANRRLGGETLAAGFVLMPAVSPDGKRAVALHKGNRGGVLDTSVTLIDLATGEATLVGRPMDTAFLSWLPDGRGFILVRRQFVAADRPTREFVASMDLEGTVTDVCPGGQPAVLPGRNRILFRDEGGVWKTCALDGKDAKLFCDGLKAYSFASPAPDGKRVLMIRTAAGKAPEVDLITVDSGEIRPGVRAPGLWGQPAWP